MEFSECFLLMLLWSVLCFCVCVCVCFEIFATKMSQSVTTNVALQMQEASSQTAAAAVLSKLLASLVATAARQSDCCPSSACQELCWRLGTSCLSFCKTKPKTTQNKLLHSYCSKQMEPEAEHCKANPLPPPSPSPLSIVSHNCSSRTFCTCFSRSLSQI
jgi:hypothetical protein